ncbi:MAG: sigma-70 family RNA polymerase sigma factor [Saprospiraceae bacterium]|nr:sigma-70 family RNA polymerase sigma factor [Saprospiraceae bacterium]
MDFPAIIEKCQSGDRNAQSELYAILYQELLNVPMRYMNNKEEANGVFNQGMLKIFQSLDQAAEVSNFIGWAYTIIHRTTIDHLRKMTNYKKKYLTVADYSKIDSFMQVTEILDRLEVADIFKVIQRLPQSERTVFSLFEIDGFKHKEIGKMLGISESNSKYILHTAKKKLQKLLSNYSSNLKVR